MKVSKVEEQGLRLALGLARLGGRSTLPELARQEELSVALTAKILARLRRGGVIRALRGRHGHYALASAPEQTTVASVLRAIEPHVIVGCFNEAACDHHTKGCPHGDNCSLRPVWRRIERQVEAVLDRITIADLLGEEGQVDAQVVRLLGPRQVPAAAESEVQATGATEPAGREAEG